MEYIIALGSNEQRAENLALARQRLMGLFPDIRFSTEEETSPIGLHRSALFSNQVAHFQSNLQSEDIIPQLKAIEQEAGRTSDDKKQEIIRLDIDLLMCNKEVYKSEDLTRDYILRGLSELQNPQICETLEY